MKDNSSFKWFLKLFFCFGYLDENRYYMNEEDDKRLKKLVPKNLHQFRNSGHLSRKKPNSIHVQYSSCTNTILESSYCYVNSVTRDVFLLASTHANHPPTHIIFPFFQENILYIHWLITFRKERIPFKVYYKIFTPFKHLQFFVNMYPLNCCIKVKFLM
jgi:hypothetical protein